MSVVSFVPAPGTPAGLEQFVSEMDTADLIVAAEQCLMVFGVQKEAVHPKQRYIQRGVLEIAAMAIIEFLDREDADSEDLEPSLGWTVSGARGTLEDLEQGPAGTVIDLFRRRERGPLPI